MHLVALKFKQKKVFEKLKSFSQFYLSGGTALALQIGHRISVDFDLFSEEKIQPSLLLKKIKRVFQGFQTEVILNEPGQLSVKADDTRIDFVYYKFPLVLKLLKFKGVKIAQVLEIAAMKVFTLGYRGVLKDYVDLYFILKDGHAVLKKIKEIAEKKYKNEFNFRLVLEQLIYLEDIKPERVEFLKEPVKKEQLKEFFEEEIKKIKL